MTVTGALSTRSKLLYWAKTALSKPLQSFRHERPVDFPNLSINRLPTPINIQQNNTSPFSSPQLDLDLFIELRKTELSNPAYNNTLGLETKKRAIDNMETLLKSIPKEALDKIYLLAKTYYCLRNNLVSKYDLQRKPMFNDIRKAEKHFYFILSALLNAVFHDKHRVELNHLAIAIYGSSARGEGIPSSDIEFAMIGEPGYDQQKMRDYHQQIMALALIFHLPVEGKNEVLFIQGESSGLFREMIDNSKYVSINTDLAFYSGNRAIFNDFVSDARSAINNKLGFVIANLLKQSVMRPKQKTFQDTIGQKNGILNLRIKKGAQRFFNIIHWMVSFTYDLPNREISLSSHSAPATFTALNKLKEENIITRRELAKLKKAFKRMIFIRLRLSAVRGDVVTEGSVRAHLAEIGHYMIQDMERAFLFPGLADAPDPIGFLTKTVAADMEFTKEILGRILALPKTKQLILQTFYDDLQQYVEKKNQFRRAEWDKKQALLEKENEKLINIIMASRSLPDLESADPAATKTTLGEIKHQAKRLTDMRNSTNETYGSFAGSPCDLDSRLIFALIKLAEKQSGRVLYEILETAHIATLAFRQKRYFGPNFGRDPDLPVLIDELKETLPRSTQDLLDQILSASN
ncbi:MAG: hypothetical protein PHH14_00050 [Candidatus Margulisbacteria bacterium]|nr:hypothetical protein [Candidatus Margulisiibacteriota bacterium]